MNEDAVTSHTSLEAARLGLLLMRNNLGACFDQTGRMIRYGLMNESKKVNSEFKSSDQIGLTPVQIGPQHIGRVMGIFTALEIKESGWVYNPKDEHEKAQLRFHNLVRTYGGIADFVSDPAQVYQIIRGHL